MTLSLRVVLLALFSTLIQVSPLSGQTVFWMEEFQNGCNSLCLASAYVGPNGAWTQTSTGVNGSFANEWFVSCAENGGSPGTCGLGCGTDQTLHISSVVGSPGGLCPTGDCGAAYDASNSTIITNKRIESPQIDCSGYLNLQLRYNYISAGSPGTDFYDVMYSSDGGSSWGVLATGPTSPCCCNIVDCFFSGCCEPSTTVCGSLRQGSWRQATLLLPANASNNPNVKIGFNWTNNGDNSGTDPSVAIDDIELLGETALPAQLRFFQASLYQDRVLLEWATGTGSQTALFTIERSDDLTNWVEMGVMPGMDQPDSIIAYRFWDELPLSGISYYRLRQSDTDGLWSYSRVASVQKEIAEPRIQFDPVRKQLHILSEPGSQITGLHLRNMLGRTVSVLIQREGDSWICTTAGIVPGLYLLSIGLSGGTVVKKVRVY